jgi:hypothetical protein
MTAAVQQLQSVGRASGRYKSPDSWRQGADFITVLTSKGPLLTKRWTSDGIEPYDRAKQFTAEAYQVSDIRGLSSVLAMLEEQPRRCAIRGRHLAHDDAGTKHEGCVETTRDLQHFTEAPHHWVCLDVDEWVMPEGIDLDDPASAVASFIQDCLPAEFQEITHHWQLSSSAGAPGKGHLLKAHIWFWLDEQRTGQELEAWARGLSLPVDITVFRTVQVHYTAAPVIDPGVSCPIGTRSGLTEGILGDEVSLVMPDVLELPRAERVGRAGMVDPRGKPGLIGAFCRAYPPHRVVTEILPEVFEYEGDSDVRLTWLQGGGSPGGACITDDELRIYNSHATDPFAGHAQNMWDLVRHFKFGDLDTGIDPEAVAFAGPSALPSQKAMTEWVKTLEDVAIDLEDVREEEGKQRLQERIEPAISAAPDREQAFQLALKVIEDCTAPGELETVVAPRLRVQTWGDSERERLAEAIRRRHHDLASINLRIDTVRAWLAPPVSAGGFPDINASGRVMGTIGNVEALCRQHSLTVRYNAMLKEHEILIPGRGFTLDNRANATLSHLLSLCKAVDMKINTGELKGYVCSIGDANQHSPPLVWIGSRPWDGVDRLQAWFDTLEGPTEKRCLKDALMRRWAIQAVAMLHNGGNEMARGVLTLTGIQALGKTRWFKSLAPEGMVATGVLLDPNNKDSIKQCIRAWITELGELDGTMRKADIAAFKSFISLTTDVYRAPYLASESALPRRTVFGATVNEREFMRDSTGNTRLWTIEVERVNADHGIDMQQLWAQVYELWKAGEQHWPSIDELALLNESNEDYSPADPLEEKFRQALPWEDPTAERIWATATRASQLAQITITPGEAARVGKVIRLLNGNQMRRSGRRGRELLIPIHAHSSLP